MSMLLRTAPLRAARVARQQAQQARGVHFENKVDQCVLLGTPRRCAGSRSFVHLLVPPSRSPVADACPLPLPSNLNPPRPASRVNLIVHNKLSRCQPPHPCHSCHYTQPHRVNPQRHAHQRHQQALARRQARHLHRCRLWSPLLYVSPLSCHCRCRVLTLLSVACTFCPMANSFNGTTDMFPQRGSTSRRPPATNCSKSFLTTHPHTCTKYIAEYRSCCSSEILAAPVTVSRLSPRPSVA